MQGAIIHAPSSLRVTHCVFIPAVTSVTRLQTGYKNAMRDISHWFDSLFRIPIVGVVDKICLEFCPKNKNDSNMIRIFIIFIQLNVRGI